MTKAKKTKTKTGQTRRRSNLGHRAPRPGYAVTFHMLTVTRQLRDACEPLHTTKYTLSYNIYKKYPFTDIYSSNHTFGPTVTLPYPEVKSKTETKETKHKTKKQNQKTKTKQNQNKTGQVA
jgi:hypothetical protein